MTRDMLALSDLVAEVRAELRATNGETGQALRTVATRRGLTQTQRGALFAALLTGDIASSPVA